MKKKMPADNTQHQQVFSHLQTFPDGAEVFTRCRFENCRFCGARLDKLTFEDCTFYGCDLSLAQVQGTAFKEVLFEECKMQGLPLYTCARWLLAVRFKNCVMRFVSFANLPLKNTVFENCDLSGQDCLCFGEEARVYFDGDTILPDKLDVSMCSEVWLWGCDLGRYPDLSFRDGADVFLTKATNLPENLDVSMCANINLSECDLSNQSNLHFRENSLVNIEWAKNIPANLDFSMCSVVSLKGSDVSGNQKLCFKDKARVFLQKTILPPLVDVSRCSELHMDDCDLSHVKRLVFKNEEQMKESRLKLPDAWAGKIIFTDTLNQNQKNLSQDNGYFDEQTCVEVDDVQHHMGADKTSSGESMASHGAVEERQMQEKKEIKNNFKLGTFIKNLWGRS